MLSYYRDKDNHQTMCVKQLFRTFKELRKDILATEGDPHQMPSTWQLKQLASIASNKRQSYLAPMHFTESILKQSQCQLDDASQTEETQKLCFFISQSLAYIAKSRKALQ